MFISSSFNNWIITASVSSTPRSRSPTKLPRPRNGVTSPTHTPKTPSYSGTGPILRSPNVSAPVTPELRTRSLTATASTASSSITPPDDAWIRTAGSSSLHHALSFSSFQPRVVTQLEPENYGTVSATSSPRLLPTGGAIILDRDTTSSPTLRIRSKVSTVAKAADSSAPPAHPSTRSPNNPTRSSSVVSPQPTSPPPQFYPITTATSAANPHRYASVRPPPSRTFLPASSQIFQNVTQLPGSSTNDSPPSRNRSGVKINGIQAKVDPSTVPLPPTSPPMSAVSLSSWSSVSRSSASVSAVDDGQSTSTASSNSSRSAIQKNGGIHHLSATLDNLVQYASGLPSADDSALTSDDGDKDEEHKVRAAAKSNRKVTLDNSFSH